MPIEVRELVIKATVTPADGSTHGAAAASGSSGNNNVSAQEEIINICVEKIMVILKEKYER